MAVFVLEREELQISTPSAVDTAASPLASAAPWSCVEERSLAWIASLNELGFTRDGLSPAVFGDLSTGPVIARVKVAGGRIAAVGDKLGAGRETIEADGRALAPGIIDGHTHYDAQITWDPFADPSPALGVTTIVIGNCGFTIAPCRPQDRDLTMRNLTHVEGMSLAALRAGIQFVAHYQL